MAQAFGIVSFAGNNIRVGEMQNYRPVGAVSFLGRYRVIDFPISNMSNSEIEHIQVYVRRKPRSLTEHLGTGRHYNINSKSGRLHILYSDFANAEWSVYNNDLAAYEENMECIEAVKYPYVVIAPSYMIYTQNYDELLKTHIESGADITLLYHSVDNAKEILKLLTAFEMVDKSVNYTKDFAGIVSNRNTRDYEMLMQWSKVFLLNKNFTTFSGDTAAQSLLFPMELVYESYVAQQMKKVMSPAGWQVSSQEKKKYLFDNSKSFALKPDIVMKRDGRIVILDTKWKELDGKENGSNYGISQADMYQMYAYSKKYGTSEIWLLYPINDAVRKEGNREPVKFVSEDKNSKTEVNVYFVDLDKIEESLEILKARLEE